MTIPGTRAFNTINYYWIFFLFAAGIMLTSCSQNTGRLVTDNDVTKIFETYTVLEDHNYYYHGPEASPKAVVGINEKYQLIPSPQWKTVNLTPEQLNSWLNYPRPKVGYNFSRRGMNIAGPNGEKIGIWYPVESWPQTSRITLENGNRLSLGAPVKSNTGNTMVGRSLYAD